jgi:hypothetical protein
MLLIHLNHSEKYQIKRHKIDLEIIFFLFSKEFYGCLFNKTDLSISQKACSIYQALCLPVSVQELLQANQLGGVHFNF